MMTDREIFDNTVRPDTGLFYRKGDPEDPRMGEFVQREPQRFDRARMVILGSPQDIGVLRNGGRPGASRGPEFIRRMLYRLPVPERTRPDRIFDLGDIPENGTLEDIHLIQRKVVSSLLGKGKKCIVLGGGNDISFPDGAAFCRQNRKPVIINIDSHYDVRGDDIRNSGTPYRQILEGGYLPPERFYEMAVKPLMNAPRHERFVRERGVGINTLNSLREKGIRKTFNSILRENSEADALFWGFDMDSVRATDAPGVSAPYPSGLNAEEVLEIADIAGRDSRSNLLEISEVNPRLDIDNRTSRLAAMMIQRYLSSPRQWVQ